jgi:hypothetical protein
VKNASLASMVMPARGRQIHAGVALVLWNTPSPTISAHLVKLCRAIPTSTPVLIVPLVMKAHTARNALQVRFTPFGIFVIVTILGARKLIMSYVHVFAFRVLGQSVAARIYVPAMSVL